MISRSAPVTAVGHEATFAPGQTGRSRTAFDGSRATHRATGIRHINSLPLSPRWATNVTAWPAATRPRCEWPLDLR